MDREAHVTAICICMCKHMCTYLHAHTHTPLHAHTQAHPHCTPQYTLPFLAPLLVSNPAKVQRHKHLVPLHLKTPSPWVCGRVNQPPSLQGAQWKV